MRKWQPTSNVFLILKTNFVPPYYSQNGSLLHLTLKVSSPYPISAIYLMRVRRELIMFLFILSLPWVTKVVVGWVTLLCPSFSFQLNFNPKGKCENIFKSGVLKQLYLVFYVSPKTTHKSFYFLFVSFFYFNPTHLRL